jgi:pimeloyl-ACP methyl ester carboxylesterase
MKRRALISGAITTGAAAATIAALLTTGAAANAETLSAHHAAKHVAKPTVVLEHGAWADASGWTSVAERLQHAGYKVLAPSNPLRGLHSDSAYLQSYLKQVKGPVILVGHSYGGEVITNAAVGDHEVKALVYIAAFAPAEGESLGSLNSTKLAARIPALPLVPSAYPNADGSQGTELSIATDEYPNVFLDDRLPKAEEAAMAVEQRPLSLDAVTEKSGVPAWKTIPSWYLVASHDRAISPALERFMAHRAHAHTVTVNAPHLAMVTNPGAVTEVIEQAATKTVR